MRIVLSVLLIAFGYQGQSQVNVGEHAPAITADVWVKNPNSIFSDYRDKVIVLDFWFTNCAPCLYTMPHLNDLAETYKDNNIAFMAITFEDHQQVLEFLKKKKLLAMVGTDTTHALIDKYGVESYPQTFLIDAGGTVRWEGYPMQLTEKMIDFVLNKKYYPRLEVENNVFSSASDATKKTHAIDIKENNYMSAGSGMMMNNRELSFQNQSLSEILAILLETSQRRILLTDSMKNYDIRFKVPRGMPPGKVKSTVADLIIEELNFEAVKEHKNVDGYTLKVVNDSLFFTNAIDTTKVYFGKSTNTYKTYWQGTGLSISDLVIELENRFGVYVFDDTLLNGYFEFKFSIGNFAEAAKDLADNYGLELISEEKKAEILVLKQ
jgi:uncharacterized protein (TIGR03435 family)